MDTMLVDTAGVCLITSNTASELLVINAAVSLKIDHMVSSHKSLIAVSKVSGQMNLDFKYCRSDCARHYYQVTEYWLTYFLAVHTV